MKRPAPFLLAASFVLALGSAPPAQESIELLGGQVFDGEGFVGRDLFLVDGAIRSERPAKYNRLLRIEEEIGAAAKGW